MNFKVDQGEEGQKSELPALKLITNLEVKGKKYKYLPNFELNKERNDHREALLYGRLRQKLKELNKDSDGLPLTDDEIEDAIRQIHEDAFPANLDLVEANERVRTKLIGLSQESGLDEPVTVKHYGKNDLEYVRIKFFDFDHPENMIALDLFSLPTIGQCLRIRWRKMFHLKLLPNKKESRLHL